MRTHRLDAWDGSVRELQLHDFCDRKTTKVVCIKRCFFAEAGFELHQMFWFSSALAPPASHRPPPLTRCPEIGTCITSSSCSGVTAFTVGRHFCFLLSVPTPATDLQQPARLLLSLTSRGFWRIPISSSWPSSLFSPDMVSKEFAASNEHAASRTRLRLLTMKEVSHVHLRRLPERQSRSSVIDAASLLSPEAVNTDAVF